MGIVIGIDVGGSTTKIVGVEDKKIKNPMFVKATDPVTSLFGAFGKYIYDNNISLSNIEKVILTGVGSAYIDQPLYGLPTAKTDEFLANGLGAQYNTGLDSLLVVSMGTGTSFVKVQGSTVEHIGQGAVFASLNGDIKNIVLIGNLTRLPQCPDIFPRLEEMCDVHFKIPEYAEYRTAIGAALCYIRNREYRDIFCGKC